MITGRASKPEALIYMLRRLTWECKLAGLLWHVEMQSVCIVIRESLLISPLGGRDKR